MIHQLQEAVTLILADALKGSTRPEPSMLHHLRWHYAVRTMAHKP
jgi:hypothetical protein